MELNQTGENRLKYVPESLVKAVGSTLIVKPTNMYCRTSTESGVVFSNGGDTHLEKKYDIGEVVSVGPTVNPELGIEVGDVVVWQCSRGYRLPNGTSDSGIFSVMSDETSLMAHLPNVNVIDDFDTEKEGITEVLTNWGEETEGSRDAMLAGRSKMASSTDASREALSYKG